MGNHPSRQQAKYLLDDDEKNATTHNAHGALPPSAACPPPGLTETSRSNSASPPSAIHHHHHQHQTASIRKKQVTISVRSEATASSIRSGGSWRSGGSSSTVVKATNLHENLMRCQQRDPLEIYELVNVLGEGSMGSVCKVRKRASAVGGSARPDFVKKSSGRNSTTSNHCCIPFLSHVTKLLPTRESSLRLVEEELPHYSYDNNSKDDKPKNPKTLRKKPSSMISYSSSSQRKDNQQYALKSIHLDKCSSKSLQKELLNEVAILRELDHAHIARAIETFDFNDRLFIVLELCSGGDLYARDPYTEERAAEIITSVLSAVAYLHYLGVVHRDLKYENIMFVDKREDAEVKIIDFGLSQKFAGADQEMSDAVGTVYTMAPELLAGQYNSKVDVWSVGVIVFMLLSSSMPFYGKTRMQVMKKICKGNLKFSAKRWADVSHYGKGLVRLLLEHDPKDRPSADRALGYCRKWMQQLNPQNEQSATDSLGKAARFNSSGYSSGGDINDKVEMMDRIQASIEAFAQYNTLKKLALMVIAYKSTASEIGWLRSIFSRFDVLQNGEISLEEFTEALSEVYDYTPDEMEALFCQMDVDGTGSVHYTEFLAATIEAHGSIDEDRIAEAFDRIDCDDSGYITIQNLRDFLGDDVPEATLEAIIDDADLMHDKRISYDEFLELWDSTCYDTLCQAKQEVVERRLKHAESLLNASSVSDLGNSTSSEDADDDEDEDEEAEDETQRIREVPPTVQVDDNKQLELLSSSVPKTPLITNARTRATGNAVDCFNHRKALSLRAGWL